MSSSEPCVRTAVEDGVGWLTLNRPDALNAITVELCRSLCTALDELADRSSVIVMRGAGGNFCAGGDVNEVERLRSKGADATAELFDAFALACQRIGDTLVPVVAAVEGYAMAGGFELLLASDIVILSSNAALADNHTNFGLIPGGGSTQLLPRAVGRQRALALILTGGRLDAAQAVEWGIAYKAVPADDFDGAVRALAADLAGRSREAATKIKALVRQGLDLPLETGLAWERKAVVDHVVGASGEAGITSFTRRKDATTDD